MFTGLVEGTGVLQELRPEGEGVRVVVLPPWKEAPPTDLGASVALDGCCLTVVHADGERLEFQAGPETLKRTRLGGLKPGARINMERSLKLGAELGGHLVTGHVDAVGSLLDLDEAGGWVTMGFRFPTSYAGQIASKGSITVNGVSLTVVDASADRFSVALIPHTLAATNLGELVLGASVNLETDLLAKYVERQLAFRK